jgi:hypothetical protein
VTGADELLLEALVQGGSALLLQGEVDAAQHTLNASAQLAALHGYDFSELTVIRLFVQLCVAVLAGT